MSKITKFIIATGFAVLIAGPAYAQGISYLGPSSAVADGGEGVLGFNALCKDTFGDKAFFCSSPQILQSGGLEIPPVLADPFALEMWVRPSIVNMIQCTIAGPSCGIGQALVLDASGVLGDRNKALSCSGLSENDAALGSGLAMNAAGAFFRSLCNQEIPAACCTFKVKEK